mmetsp:Transcript_15332/g.35336  ORF Transcript_15332/g.35336 Transcript_15332/m.35336 type:complete len:212 (-) Transcript_15332:232-867(-)
MVGIVAVMNPSIPIHGRGVGTRSSKSGSRGRCLGRCCERWLSVRDTALRCARWLLLLFLLPLLLLLLLAPHPLAAFLALPRARRRCHSAICVWCLYLLFVFGSLLVLFGLVLARIAGIVLLLDFQGGLLGLVLLSDDELLVGCVELQNEPAREQGNQPRVRGEGIRHEQNRRGRQRCLGDSLEGNVDREGDDERQREVLRGSRRHGMNETE